MSAFLGVEISALGRRWVSLSDAQDRHAQVISQETDLPNMVARCLSRLGVPVKDAKTYLTPSLRELMPNPSVLKDMDKAAERICHAVDKKQKIAIFSDYDVDGATSGALLITWLLDFGLTATLSVPDRVAEGYCPHCAAIKVLATYPDLLIRVDYGNVTTGPYAPDQSH